MDWILGRISSNGGKLEAPQSHWARELGCSESTVSHAVKLLMEAGKVRWSTAADGRRCLVFCARMPLRVV
jgi:DNA-binding MarR family transcriptional regulator